MWSRAEFDRMVLEGRACMACIWTLERDALAEQLAALTGSAKAHRIVSD